MPTGIKHISCERKIVNADYPYQEYIRDKSMQLCILTRSISFL